MSGFYLRVYDLLPSFLRKRINPLDNSIREFVRGGSRSLAHLSVLDAGAGESRFADDFAGHLYVTLDLTVGDETWDYSRVDVKAELSNIPFITGGFDRVLNIQVLEHVAEPDEVLRELCRVLKPGGTLLLTAPQGWHEHQQPHDYYRFTQFSLLRMLTQAGFTEVQIEPMGGYFHYLGHRLTYVPKVLFSERRYLIRIVLFPLELFSLGVFCFLLPLICYYLDWFDVNKEFTLCYRCRARKPV